MPTKEIMRAVDEADWHELTEEELAEIDATEYDWDTGLPLPRK